MTTMGMRVIQAGTGGVMGVGRWGRGGEVLLFLCCAAQEATKTVRRRPMTPPRNPKTAQDRSNTAQERLGWGRPGPAADEHSDADLLPGGHRGPEHRPRGAHDTPKTSKIASKMLP